MSGLTALSTPAIPVSRPVSEQARKVEQRFRACIAKLAADPANGRANYRTLGEGFTLPSDVAIEATRAGGVPAEWVRTSASRRDRILLYIHGGGYVTGDAAAYRHLVAEIARATTAGALSIDYALAPEAPFPAGIEDTVRAYLWLVDQGFDPSSIVMAGDSAGGGLILASLLTLRDRALPMPAGAWLISPYADLERTSETTVLKAAVDPIAVPAEKREASTAAYLGGVSVRDPRASPVHADLTGLPPLRIDVGSHETLLDDALTIARNAALRDVDVSLQVWRGMVHIFPYFAPILREGREAIAAGGDFLARHLDHNRTPVTGDGALA